jgi:hypothetical protein
MEDDRNVYKMRRWFISGKRDSGHRLIFCINSGRSGSNYLAEILGSAAEVTSFHEAEPHMNGRYLDMVNRYPYRETFRKRQIKSAAIRKILHRFPPRQVYCETNHMFIKTFFDVILSDFKNVEVVILRRELALVLKSFIELGYFSPKNPVWADWMSSPNARTSALPCTALDAELDQFDLCIAYLFDIEARAIRFQKEFPDVPTLDVRLESLNDFEQIRNLFAWLRIEPTENTRMVSLRTVNERKEKKKRYGNPTDLDYCRERIHAYIKNAQAAGIVLPRTAALAPYDSGGENGMRHALHNRGAAL